GNPGGHRGSAAFQEEITTVSKSRGEVEAFYAASRTAPLIGSVTAEDDHGPVEFAEDAAGDDPNDADVPAGVALDDGEIRFRVEPGVHRGNDFIHDLFFDCLPHAVLF